ncbi:hypothetical protein C5167_049750 [Papaver somniferum]|uniref:Uncharacterized protein n=1 Tax=Papaver somniferum TaxID=3469 RepID=A0A4Y7KLN5_PAPSO|nr:hypothetical protein C5167_049750 [Papaver somniferum]
MENDLLCCQFDNLDFATISQGQSPISLIEIDFLCNTFKGLNLDDGDHNKIQASESEILDGFAHCQASITSKVPSLMSGNFNSSLEINCQARFTLFGKFHSVIPIRSVYLDDDGVSDDLNFKLSDEIDRTLQTSSHHINDAVLSIITILKKVQLQVLDYMKRDCQSFGVMSIHSDINMDGSPRWLVILLSVGFCLHSRGVDKIEELYVGDYGGMGQNQKDDLVPYSTSRVF